MIIGIAFIALALAAAGGFFWGRYEREENRHNYEALRYQAVACIRKLRDELAGYYIKLPPWYSRKIPPPRIDITIREHRLIAHHMEEVDL